MIIIPVDSTGMVFVTELAHLFLSLCDGAAIEPLLISLMVMHALHLQNTNVDSKLDSHLLCSYLQRHLALKKQMGYEYPIFW